MRTYNSIKNIIVSMGLGLVAVPISFIAQKIFIENLSVDYLGINGLFTNIISMLAIAELGLGSAIIYHLYKPFEEKDTKKINSLMKFYKSGYRVIALIVGVIGLLIMPFLPAIVGHTNVSANLNIIYLMFVGDVILSYLLSYKRSILYADQKNYIINTARIMSMILLNLIQIVILVMTHDYYLYLITKIAMTVVENLVLNFIIDKKYPLLKNNSLAESLDGETKKDVFKKIKGLLFHKAGSFFILGSDNIVIAMFFGVKVVGLYSNYLLVIAVISSMISQLSTAIIASVGNLLLINDHARHYGVFKRIHFANFWISSVVTISFLVVIDSFITLWVGKEFILSIGVLAALSLNLYLTLARSALYSFKTAAGIFHEDRFVPLIESAVNIILSITFLHFFGLAGVFMGTICSNLVVHLYSYPRYVYTKLFKKSYREYYIEFTTYLVVAILTGIITFMISRSIVIENNMLHLATNIGICLIVPNIIFYILYRNSDEFSYYKALISKMINKARRR